MNFYGILGPVSLASSCQGLAQSKVLVKAFASVLVSALAEALAMALARGLGQGLGQALKGLIGHFRAPWGPYKALKGP